MHDLLPFIVSGIVTGSVYGLAGIGLVVSYRASGIFNLGYGALAAAAAYLFYWLHVSHGVSWQVSAFIALLIAGPLMGLGMERLARHLGPQRTVMKVVGTLGLILVVQGVGTVMYGPDAITFPQYFPGALDHFRIGGANVTQGSAFIGGTSVLAALLLYGLFRWSRLGLEIRAVVDDPDLLSTKGTDPIRVRRAAWILSSTLAALSGILIAPVVGLDSIGLTFLVVQAFGAAAIGMFKSLPLTFTGGLVIGVLSAISKKYVLSVTWLAGLPSSIPFIALFIVLLLIPRRKLVTAARAEARPPIEWRAPPSVRIFSYLVVFGILIAVPLLVGTKLSYFTTGLTEAILFLSLGLLIRTSGQVSLCHAAFAAVGAVAFAQFSGVYHWPWIVAILAAAAVAIPVGAVVAIPAIRLSGIFLALATFGFGIMVQYLFYPLNIMFTTYGDGRAMPRPSFGNSDRAFYYVVLAVLALVALGLTLLQQGRLGRMLRGLSDSPMAVSVMGLSVNTTKVVVFCISAFTAALAGSLYGSSINIVTGGEDYFTSMNSLLIVGILIITPFSAVPWYAILAGTMTALPLAYIPGLDTPYWMDAFFGVAAILIAAQGGPQQMPAAVRQWFARFESRPASADATESSKTQPNPVPPKPAGDGLRVENLTVAFGGLVAVQDLTIAAPTGRVTGLIGPNGAGKTTTFNACFGLTRSQSGRVLFDGADLTGMAPSARARRGMGRTFQIVQLCESLTVRENVALGHESGLAGGRVLSQLWAPRSQRRSTADAAAAALDLCGIVHLADRQAGELSTGQRRLVELARCLAGNFHVLLLDEPSSGLDRTETAQFAAVLGRVLADRNVGILLVEHDMELVMAVCSYIYVLDFGRLLYEGTSAEVAASEIVRDAYLGAIEATSPDGRSNEPVS